jgi:hypothetical protein
MKIFLYSRENCKILIKKIDTKKCAKQKGEDRKVEK